MSKSVRDVDMAVVVVSSDGYSDFWPIFFACWKKYSPFAGMPIYLLTASKSFSAERVRVINTPHLAEASWSDRIKEGLLAVEHEYVLVLTEDLLCVDHSQVNFLEVVLQFIQRMRPTCLRLIPHPPPQGRYATKDIAAIPPWAMHRASLQASIWNRRRLIELFTPGKSPSDFEISATKQSRADPAYYCVTTRAFPLLEVIGQGRVTRKGARFIRGAGLGEHLERDVFTLYNEFIREWRTLKASFFYFLPLFLQRWLLIKGVVGATFK